MTADSSSMMTPRLLTLPEVIALTGLGRDAIYRLGREGRFPKHLKISERASRWRDDELRQWLEARTALRDQGEDTHLRRRPGKHAEERQRAQNC